MRIGSTNLTDSDDSLRNLICRKTQPQYLTEQLPTTPKISLVEAGVYVGAALDVQLQVHEALPPAALVLHVDTIQVVAGVALKQLVDDLLNTRALAEDGSKNTRHPMTSCS